MESVTTTIVVLAVVITELMEIVPMIEKSHVVKKRKWGKRNESNSLIMEHSKIIL